MKKLIAAAIAVLITAASLCGCMSTQTSLSEDGAAAYVEIKADKQAVLAVDKDKKVILTVYREVGEDGSTVTVDKKSTEFDGLELAGRSLSEAVTAILEKLGDRKLTVRLEAGGVTTDAAKKALSELKTELPEQLKGLTEVTVTFVEKTDESGKTNSTVLLAKPEEQK